MLKLTIVNNCLLYTSEMARLIQYPSALAVEKFRGGMTLLRVVIPEKSVLNGMSVAEFAISVFLNGQNKLFIKMRKCPQ